MSRENFRLIEPTAKLKEEFLAMVYEYLETDEPRQDWRFEQAKDDFEAYVKKLRDHSVGKNIPEGWVPSSTFWLIDNQQTLLGHSSIRHQLTPTLRTFGGHIGYYIRPSQRQKGHGVRILKLTLEKAKRLSLKRVFITCDDDNIASIKIIETNGGKLKDKIMNEGHKVPTRRYWIELKLRGT